MLLGRPYYETIYRSFSNVTVRWIVDHTLAASQKNEPVSSGLVSVKSRQAWVTSESGFLWNLIRYWTEWLMTKHDVMNSWVQNWREYISGIPRVGLGDWDEWDAHLTVLLRSTYLEYWNTQLPNPLHTDIIQRFWTMLWLAYADAQNIKGTSLLPHIQPVIARLAETGPFDLSLLRNIDSVIREMCERSGIQWDGVGQPAWTQFLLYGTHPMWEEPELSPDWDVPLLVLSSAAGHVLDEGNVVEFLESHIEDIAKRLQSSIDSVDCNPTELYEFWFPLQNHKLLENEVVIGACSKFVGLSDAMATQLTNAGGIGPRPSANAGDAYVVVSSYGKTLRRACEDALRELGDIQTMLRVADTGFRWETSFYYYWKLRESRHPLPPDGFYIAERRDNRQVYPPLTSKWLTKYNTWLSRIEEKPGELADALFIAMKWQGLSRVQDGAESEFLCLWIALERLGNGSYHYRKIIPLVAGTLWHLSMWSQLPDDDQPFGFEQDRKMMQRIIHDLGDLRNREVAHRGQFRDKKDVRYATWILKHLVNDLTRWLISVVTERDDIQTFNDLSNWVETMVSAR